MDDFESIIQKISGKDSAVLCREVTAIGENGFADVAKMSHLCNDMIYFQMQNVEFF